MKLAIFFLISSTVSANILADFNPLNVFRGVIEPLSQERVDFINQLGTWRAFPFFKGLKIEDFKVLLGGLLKFEPGDDDAKIFHRDDDFDVSKLPENFDSRENWPLCADVINHIRDQGSCGSCFAVASASAITDRLCIASNGLIRTPLSSQQIMSCCSSCTQGDATGCQGGWAIKAWMYWVNEGLVTGADHGDKSTCQPYSVPPCEHHVKGDRPSCGSIVSPPQCTKDQCTNDIASNKKNHGKTAFTLDNSPDAIKTELFKRGPLCATFVVHDDFALYLSGIYQVTPGAKELGGHVVAVIGWGKTEDGIEYWLCRNSWNTDWGEKGYFRIKMGESKMTNFVAGIPMVSSSSIL